jgi:hypothetical protein
MGLIEDVGRMAVGVGTVLLHGAGSTDTVWAGREGIGPCGRAPWPKTPRGATSERMTRDGDGTMSPEPDGTVTAEPGVQRDGLVVRHRWSIGAVWVFDGRHRRTGSFEHCQGNRRSGERARPLRADLAEGA